MSAILTGALALSEKDRAEIHRLAGQHDDGLRRTAADAKRQAIEHSEAAARRLDEIVIADHAALAGDPGDPMAPSWPSVAFIRTTPGAGIPDSHIEESNSWAKWYCTQPSLSSGREKLSFFFLWQNPKKALALADISLRLTILGHFECSAEGWGSLRGGSPRVAATRKSARSSRCGRSAAARRVTAAAAQRSPGAPHRDSGCVQRHRGDIDQRVGRGEDGAVCRSP